jgi:hypothetical protein
VDAHANRRRWPTRLAGAAVGMSAYASFALLDLAEQPEPGCLMMCGHGLVFLALVAYGTPVLAVVAGLLALSPRTRPFSAGLTIGMVVSLLAFGIWLPGRY